MRLHSFDIQVIVASLRLSGVLEMYSQCIGGAAGGKGVMKQAGVIYAY